MTDSIIIKSTDTNNKVNQKTITFINPEASNADLKTFAQGLNALTTNSYNETVRIEKINVDTEDDRITPAKTEPTLSIGELTYSLSGFDGYTGFEAVITYNGDGQLSAVADKMTTIYQSGNEMRLFIKASSNAETCAGTLHASEGTNYAAKSVAFAKEE